MIALISRAAARSREETVKSALDGVRDILFDHARIHHALQIPDHSTLIDASAYIRVLCHCIQRAKLDARGIQLTLVATPLQMHSERCWRLGLILSELIENSVRHAFNGRSGSISVDLSLSGSIAECCVCDDGSSKGLSRAGSGLKIIRALVKELDGDIVHRFSAGGSTSILIFPVGACGGRG
jgi:two-component sensor histidine kinase